MFIDKNNSLNYSIENSYFRYIFELGFQPVLLDPLNINRIDVNNTSCLFLTGAGNINSVEKNKSNKTRDKIDLNTYNFFISKNIPIISICRSSQLLLTKIYKLEIYKNKEHVRKSHIIKNNKKKN